MAALALLVPTAVVGLRNELVVTHYTVPTEHVAPGDEVRIALLTDLHSDAFPGGPRALHERVLAEDPDLILLAGDLIDDVAPRDRGLANLAPFVDSVPTFYVSGNHEQWTGEIGVVLRQVRDLGLPVLQGQAVDLTVGATPVSILGLDDPDIGRAEYERQLRALEDGAEEREGQVSILLAHRPDHAEDYVDVGADVIVAGHAHGGQWRIPGLVDQGLYAPGQGVFPQRTHGVFETDAGTLVISRGLSTQSTPVPRLFNPPEIVVLTLRAP